MRYVCEQLSSPGCYCDELTRTYGVYSVQIPFRIHVIDYDDAGSDDDEGTTSDDDAKSDAGAGTSTPTADAANPPSAPSSDALPPGVNASDVRGRCSKRSTVRQGVCAHHAVNMVWCSQVDMLVSIFGDSKSQEEMVQALKANNGSVEQATNSLLGL